MILAEFLRRESGYRFYARGVNLFRQLRAGYDLALEDVDLLLLPTTAMKAQPLPPADAPVHVSVGASWMNLGNTSPFNVSHHPAMSIPCGMSEGLQQPFLLETFVAPHQRQHHLAGEVERKRHQAAHAFEDEVDWREL